MSHPANCHSSLAERSAHRSLCSRVFAVLTKALDSCTQVKDLVGVPKDGVLVNGDSGNDIELFAVPGVRGCMVVNAHPELKKWCDAHASPNLFQVCRD